MKVVRNNERATPKLPAEPTAPLLGTVNLKRRLSADRGKITRSSSMLRGSERQGPTAGEELRKEGHIAEESQLGPWEVPLC